MEPKYLFVRLYLRNSTGPAIDKERHHVATD
jgi:hypothetical protein